MTGIVILYSRLAPIKMSFNFNAKQVFLTYPRCAESPTAIEAFLKNLLPTLQKYIICQETHQDGGFHIHCYLYLGVRLHTRNPNHFDYRCFHPNIQAVRSGRCVIDYVCKGGQYVSKQLVGGEWVEWRQKIKLDWGDAIATSDSIEGFMEKIKGGDPKVFVLQYDRLLDFASRHFATRRPPFVSRYGMEGFRWTSGMKEWYESNLINSPDRPQSLILVSPSRFGKTQWARCLGHHWYMCRMFNLEDFDSNVDYGIFDDIPIDFLKFNYKLWLGCQSDFVVSDKYKKKRTIVWGKPLIYLCNHDQYDIMKKELNFDWIECNSVIQVLTNKLY